MYTSTDEVFATAGISSTVIPETSIKLFIQGAEDEVDRFTNTTYWNAELSATADSATDDTLTDTGAFGTEDYSTDYVWIYSGEGIGQIREIISNDADVLTIDRNWTVNPNNTSKYRIIYTGKGAYSLNELRDGNNTDTLFTNHYPLQLLEAVSIDSVSVTVAEMYKYKGSGKLVLSQTTEKSRWSGRKAQKNDLTYWWGVYPVPGNVKRYVMVCAALKALMSQAGGTYNVPSTYALPEGSVTIGQAYINIRGAWDMLSKEKTSLERSLVIYASFADEPTIGSAQPSVYAGSHWY